MNFLCLMVCGGIHRYEGKALVVGGKLRCGCCGRAVLRLVGQVAVPGFALNEALHQRIELVAETHVVGIGGEGTKDLEDLHGL